MLPELEKVHSANILTLEPLLFALGRLLNSIPIVKEISEIHEAVERTTLDLSR